MPFHHVAHATADLAATIDFYENLVGFPLVHTEVQANGPASWIRHVFFDTAPGAESTAENYLAFFEFHGVGERSGWASDISDSVGLPSWVNHWAFAATEEQQQAAKARFAERGLEPAMELDHGWCHSVYFTDPNGVLIELARNTPGFEPDSEEAHRLAALSPAALVAEAGRTAAGES